VLLGVARALALTGTRCQLLQALAGYGDPNRLVGACRVLYVARDDQDRTRQANRPPVHSRHRQAFHSDWLCTCIHRYPPRTVIPSNGARQAELSSPLQKALQRHTTQTRAKAPDGWARFLMTLVYQCDVIVSAMFLTGQVSNVLISKFAQQVTGIELTYARWALGGNCPGPGFPPGGSLVLYRIFPPEVQHTPAARSLQQTN